jgi:ribosomal protein S18 acetylase RimI-like enzyme
VTVELVPVEGPSLEEFLAHFDAYRHELEAYSHEPDTLPLDRYGEAIRRDPDGQELLWIESDGKRAGFLLVREFEDWPDDSRTVVDIAECYVAPEFRRQGVGRAAVEALLERERRRDTALVEASVLRENEAGAAFWAALGFAVRSIRTAREP